MTISVTKDEVLQAKRAIVVLKEIEAMVDRLAPRAQHVGTAKQDLRTLIELVRKVEAIAT